MCYGGEFGGSVVLTINNGRVKKHRLNSTRESANRLWVLQMLCEMYMGVREGEVDFTISQFSN
jgi:hypothetical protein